MTQYSSTQCCCNLSLQTKMQRCARHACLACQRPQANAARASRCVAPTPAPTARSQRVTNFEVSTANTGSEAIEILKGETFELVLIDVVMPDISGDTLIPIVRLAMSWPAAHALALSAQFFLAIVASSRFAGARGAWRARCGRHADSVLSRRIDCEGCRQMELSGAWCGRLLAKAHPGNSRARHLAILCTPSRGDGRGTRAGRLRTAMRLTT